MKKILILPFLLFIYSSGFAAELRGFVFDKETGDPLPFASVVNTTINDAVFTNEDGYFSMTGLQAQEYTFLAHTVGYDSLYKTFKFKKDQILKINFYLSPKSNTLDEAGISANAKRRKTTTKISEINITPKQIVRFPTVGGEPDLVQYLQVLPGVVFSGDQGGQLYIRGGSPVMTKVLLDGMTIYNPFHSIGLFSVFDTDILKTTDVYSAGFSAEYGGRVSAVIDVQTRDGNNQRLAGKVNVNPFTSKILVEGPLRKFDPDRGSSSFIMSYKNSYLDRTGPIFYPYAGDNRLPYSFSDFFGKVSMKSTSGSYAKLFYFDHKDNVDFENTTSYGWNSNGFGGKFLLVPSESKTLIEAVFAYSDYFIEQNELDNRPRSSGINGFNAALNFSYRINQDEVKYGLETNGFKTEFQVYNALNRRIEQFENTTEIAGFINYKKIFREKFILEAGFRVQQYASLSNISYEPRLRFKYNFTNRFRIKGAAGVYSQNLLSAVSDRDVVNLFYGFLSGPAELPEFIGNQRVTHRMQTANHAVLGFEYDLNTYSDVTIEAYAKDFTQVTNINRNKIYDDNIKNADKPEILRKDFIVETGLAYGFDVTYRYDRNNLYLWFVYSYNNVSRFDGIQTYQPHFDRRHNINIVTSYNWGENEVWEANVRWNFGSGFPFTLTQGFYENHPMRDGIDTDIRTANGEFTILYADLNTGRLPYYHRLDASVKRSFVFKTERGKPVRYMDMTLSCTNMYNRNNIFYFNRLTNARVDQLPILPSLSVSYAF
jgi:hypothetical protein